MSAAAEFVVGLAASGLFGWWYGRHLRNRTR